MLTEEWRPIAWLQLADKVSECFDPVGDRIAAEDRVARHRVRVFEKFKVRGVIAVFPGKS